ncbi:MAG: hypothetical protein LH473_05205 [Chitinophagales bacterium]|nr:hypothetical protein [Chitinophagales bacterium]
MIVERNKFRLRFGKAKEGIALWKQMIDELKKNERFSSKVRLLTNLTGSSYTLVMELDLKGFNKLNPAYYFWKINRGAKELYQQFIQLCDSADQQLYKI